MIHELKYRFVRDTKESFQKVVGKNQSLRAVDLKGFVLVPIPSSSARKRWRGFNQSEVLGKEFAQLLKVKFNQGYLEKVKDTSPQALLLKNERARQVKGSFRGEKEKVVGKDILLFDDIWTTGATMKAAAAELKRKGATRVWGLVIASSHRS